MIFMKLKRFFNIISTISIIGIGFLIISDYHGKMIGYLIIFKYVFIFIFILYLISLIETIISIFRQGIKRNILKFISHSVLLLFFLFYIINNTEYLKSEKVLTATLYDDLSNITITLRRDGNFENKSFDFIGNNETFKGKYKMKGDTILFLEKPYYNKFIPYTLLIDKNQNAIFINKDKDGKFITKKEWLNHFDIQIFIK